VQLLRLGAVGSERPVARDDDGNLFDLSGVTGEIDGAFLAGAGIERVAEALAAGRLSPLAGEGLRVGAPLAAPGKIVCIGQNYAAHAAESGSPPPDLPIVFLKTPDTVVGPYDEVHLPRGGAKTDWEVELAVVIGRTARYLDSPSEAAECVAGYAVANDVSERAFQLELSGGQWSKGKCCETFFPLGPWLIPAADVPDVQALRLRSWVNGEARQNSSTTDMIFGVNDLIWHLSQFMVLRPGDVISTGTPEGVALSGRFPYLQAGDVMEVEVEGLGRQRQRVIAAP